MAIKDWPESEHPRYILLNKGAEALTDAQLLAIFLRTGSKGYSAIDIANNLLNEFGSLTKIVTADQQQLCQKGSGIGNAKFSQLKASIELAQRISKESLTDKEVFQNPEQTLQFLQLQLAHLTEEVFACLFLNNKHQLIHFEILFRGGINSIAIHPRVVVKQSLKYNAAALVVAHNHPSGDPHPSQADIRLTERLQTTLELIDVQLLDHIIIGDKRSCSLAELGYLG